MKPKFKIGDRVKVSYNCENDNYDTFRHKVLHVIDVATNKKEHAYYDDSVQGEALYSFKDIPLSLYEYELMPV